VKSSCTACGKLIEYEPSSAGLQIQCPHCGQPTKLAAYSAAPPPLQQHTSPAQPARRSNLWIVIWILVVCAALAVPMIGLIAAIAIPNFVKARNTAQRAACVANLKTIQGAKDRWAVDHKKAQTDEPTEADLVGPTGYFLQMPTCPVNGFYSIGPVNQKPTCTIAGHDY
jgi:hypothetical protein